jgi:hypothetical protein
MPGRSSDVLGQCVVVTTMLDKEVVEERADIAETELEEVKEKLAVVEVEIAVMKEEGGSYPLSTVLGGSDERI